jgi:hypothetical protein
MLNMPIANRFLVSRILETVMNKYFVGRKKIVWVLGVFVVSVIFFWGLFNFMDKNICLDSFVVVDDSRVPSGVIACYQGQRIGKKIDDYGKDDPAFSQSVELINGMAEPALLKNSNKIVLSNIPDHEINNRLFLIHKMWGDISEKEVKFFIDNSVDNIRTYVFSGIWNAKRPIFDFVIDISDEKNTKFLISPPSSIQSNFLGYWGFNAGYSDVPADDITGVELLKILFTYEKMCVESQFCLYYERFIPESDLVPGSDVWNDFLDGFKNKNLTQVKSSMDVDSFRRLGLNPISGKDSVDSLEPIYQALLALRPVGFLKSGNLLVAFVTHSNSEHSLHEAFARREVQPIMFYQQREDSEYVAIELNKISVFSDLLSKVNFAGSHE